MEISVGCVYLSIYIFDLYFNKTLIHHSKKLQVYPAKGQKWTDFPQRKNYLHSQRPCYSSNGFNIYQNLI